MEKVYGQKPHKNQTDYENEVKMGWYLQYMGKNLNYFKKNQTDYENKVNIGRYLLNTL